MIDAHTHLGGWSSLDALSDKIKSTPDLMSWRTRYPDLYSRIQSEQPIDNSDLLISDMDHHGFNRAMVMPTPGVKNSAVVKWASRHSGRLFPMFLLASDQVANGYKGNLKDNMAAALAELGRTKEYGMKAIGEIMPRAFTRAVDPEQIATDLSPIMEAAQDLNLPVLVPTAWTQFRGGLQYAAPLFVDELAASFPRVTFVLAKMGRSIGYFFDIAVAIACRNANVVLDTVGTKGEHLRAAIDLIGSERIMFGTDWTYTWRLISEPMPLYPLRLKALDDAKTTDHERENILERTAVRVYALPN